MRSKREESALRVLKGIGIFLLIDFVLGFAYVLMHRNY
jgi:hypothetical protein